MKSFKLYYLFLLGSMLSCTGHGPNTNLNEQVTEIHYTNPILPLDYSDPDVIHANGKFYMTASSFQCIPGLPLLESTNLVDWKLVGYAVERLDPDSIYSKPQHGNGIWAPAIRYHQNQFYIYYSDPDYGIFRVTAKNIEGPWSSPQLVKAGKGWIDPCPFWDDNGKAWLIHAWAGSRAGIKSTLTLHQMNPDGSQLLDEGILIFDGHLENKTVEGPKMYKRNGYYYIFAPAGGVTEGWQLAMRSKNITGPYEVKKVMQQGNTSINGPHQGAWIETAFNQHFFIHFQDKDAFGRVVHLQPMRWENDWPLIGEDINNDGIGEPVKAGEIKGINNKSVPDTPVFSDEFNQPELNANWQWHANPNALWGSPSGYLGFLRLNAVVPENPDNLWEVPNLLLQKFPAYQFATSTKIKLFLHQPGDKAGLVIMGTDYAYIGVEKYGNTQKLVYRQCLQADKGTKEVDIISMDWSQEDVFLSLSVDSLANCIFSYSYDGNTYTSLSPGFKAKPGRWIGAKTGLFCLGKQPSNDAGYINVDWFRFKFESIN